jgi:hypothetical protein
MTKQSEAMPSEKWIEKHFTMRGQIRKAAAELRRLHEMNAELLFQMRYIQEQTNVGHIHDVVSAAIAKSEGEKA